MHHFFTRKFHSWRKEILRDSSTIVFYFPFLEQDWYAPSGVIQKRWPIIVDNADVSLVNVWTMDPQEQQSQGRWTSRTRLYASDVLLVVRVPGSTLNRHEGIAAGGFGTFPTFSCAATAWISSVSGQDCLVADLVTSRDSLESPTLALKFVQR